MTKFVSPPSPIARPPRVSVPIDGETLQVFERLAKVGNMSTGRAMAEWLKDTVEAAELMASTMERARSAPKLVTAELHAMALGFADQTKELQDKFRKFKGPITGAESRSASEAQPPRPAAAPNPPLCNTGGKVPTKVKSAKALKTGFPLPPAQVQAYADNNGKPPRAGK